MKSRTAPARRSPKARIAKPANTCGSNLSTGSSSLDISSMPSNRRASRIDAATSSQNSTVATRAVMPRNPARLPLRTRSDTAARRTSIRVRNATPMPRARTMPGTASGNAVSASSMTGIICPRPIVSVRSAAGRARARQTDCGGEGLISSQTQQRPQSSNRFSPRSTKLVVRPPGCGLRDLGREPPVLAFAKGYGQLIPVHARLVGARGTVDLGQVCGGSRGRGA